VLKPKGKRQGEDDSAANKVFLGDIGQAGQSRSTFEHNRYRIIPRFRLLMIVSGFPAQIIVSCLQATLQRLEIRSE
jgi:hypothetical protein